MKKSIDFSLRPGLNHPFSEKTMDALMASTVMVKIQIIN